MAASLSSVFQNLDDGTSPVEVLMIGCSNSDANQCAVELRNRGQAVHIKQAHSETELARLLETEPGDLVVVSTDSGNLELPSVIDTLRASNPGTAVILYGSKSNSLVNFAAEHGIRDMVDADNTAHLAFAIKREYQTLLMRQEMSKLRHRLQESERRFDGLLGTSRDAVAYVHEGMLIHANDAYLTMFGIGKADDLMGLTLMDLVAPSMQQDFKKVLRTLTTNQMFETEVHCVGNDGRSFTALMEFSPAEYEGEACTQIVIRDDSLQEELKARIDELTYCDPQTGLYNRNAFMERLDSVLSSGALRPGGGLVQVKIQNFDAIRNEAGLDKCDHLLQTVADILKQQSREGDTLARFGEHDFIALVEQPEALSKLGERCLAALSQQDFFNSDQLLNPPEFSIGVTPCPAGGISAHELVSRSCHATGLAETSGSNQMKLYTEAPKPSAEGQPDASLVQAIDNALEKNRFRLYYQPIVSLQGDTRENYSVLLRMLDDEGNENPLDEYWEHAENSGRLAEIDRWVIRNSIRELAQHRANGEKINFQVMLSRAGFTDESMLLWVCDCLREFKAKGAWLTIQFSEKDLRDNLEPARRLIDGLKKINCRLAVSHYEDESSSQALLTHFPVDIVKLSPDFMEGLVSQPGKQEYLSELNGRLQSAGLKTIASSVEDANTLAILWNIGVNYAQGAFLQEPSSTIEAE